MNPATLAFAFSAGMLASVNPCGFAMLPAFISYYVSGEDEEEFLYLRLAKALWFGLLVTMGFLVVFLISGGILSAGGRILILYTPLLGLVVGIALVAVGLLYLFDHALPFTLPIPDWDFKQRGPKAMLLYGVAYALASLSCTIPIFLSVLAGALASGNIADGIVVFASYGLGMGVVMTTVAMGSALFQGAVTMGLRRVLPHVKTISSGALVLAGLYLIYYQIALNPFISEF
ncbi:MAG: cytochrome c biogenesis protein CcdA [Chloroflexi bacterium]|nr:MAG: cytochrome c biogenesis protein CcdA [Chloroflexota bacterium]